MANLLNLFLVSPIQPRLDLFREAAADYFSVSEIMDLRDFHMASARKPNLLVLDVSTIRSCLLSDLVSKNYSEHENVLRYHIGPAHPMQVIQKDGRQVFKFYRHGSLYLPSPSELAKELSNFK